MSAERPRWVLFFGDIPRRVLAGNNCRALYMKIRPASSYQRSHRRKNPSRGELGWFNSRRIYNQRHQLPISPPTRQRLVTWTGVLPIQSIAVNGNDGAGNIAKSVIMQVYATLLKSSLQIVLPTVLQ